MCRPAVGIRPVEEREQAVVGPEMFRDPGRLLDKERDSNAVAVVGRRLGEPGAVLLLCVLVHGTGGLREARRGDDGEWVVLPGP